jgi:hypothetical protein
LLTLGDVLRIVLYIVWALFAAGALYSMLHVVRKTRRAEQRSAGWPRVEAAVTGSRAGRTSGVGNTSRTPRYFPKYQFTDAGGRQVTGESEVSSAEEPLPGSTIEVAYNPADPAESFQVSTQAKATLGCLIPLFAVFAAALFWFIGVFPLP